jgi:hypothetical protein
MARQIIIILLLFASLVYATVTYWPLIAPFVPYKPPTQSAVTAPVVKPAAKPAGTSSAEAAEKPPEPLDEIVTPTIEVKLIDPFALRIDVKTRAEEPLPAVKLPGPESEKPAVKPAEPKLEGVWIDSGMRVAFISGTSLPVGGTILGWKVTSINKERVILQKGSLTKTLKVEGR